MVQMKKKGVTRIAVNEMLLEIKDWTLKAMKLYAVGFNNYNILETHRRKVLKRKDCKPISRKQRLRYLLLIDFLEIYYEEHFCDIYGGRAKYATLATSPLKNGSRFLPPAVLFFCRYSDKTSFQNFIRKKQKPASL